MIEGRVQGVVLKRFIRNAMFDDSVFCDHDVFFRLLVAIAIYIYIIINIKSEIERIIAE